MASVHSSLSVLFLCLLLVAAARTQNPADDVQTLLTFKGNVFPTVGYGIYGTGTSYFGTWNSTNENPCDWVGVRCNANSTVEELDLSGWGMSFGASDILTLSNLTSLRSLDLSSNFGDGSLESINAFTGLTHLDLSWADLYDNTTSMSTWPQSLRYISLEGNYLGGEIESLRGLVNLQVLRLGENNLTGPFPSELGEIESLVSIDLSNNNLNGTIPSLPGLTNLEEIILDNNNFTKFEEPFFPNSTNLKYFSISQNQLECTIPSSITHRVNLQILNISQNRLFGLIPPGLSQQHLIRIDLSQNNLTGQIPSELLEAYSFTNISLLQQDFSFFSYVNLSHNLLSGNISKLSFNGTNESFWNSFILDLSDNNLSGPIPFIKNNSSFYQLFLQNNYFSGDVVDVFVHSPGIWTLDTLELQNNLLTGDLSRLTSDWWLTLSINILNLSNNSLEWTRSNAVPDPLRVPLENCNLTEFWAGGNNFSGISLPSALLVTENNRHGSPLQVLDLSNTHLTGSISDIVFNSTWFPNLWILNFSNNHITGGIPQSIVNLPQLEAFNVSNNDLSGTIPPIQSSAPLYNPSFFAGNDELCGNPLSACLIKSSSTFAHWWVVMIIVGGSAIIVLGSCLVAIWRWRVYHKMHEQDADLIKTLLEGDTGLISLRELKKATDNFAIGTQIGEGGFGIVYKGQLNDGTLVAIKRSKREGFEKGKEQFLNEVRILSQVNHRNLVKLLGCCMENKTGVLVFEYISNGTLQEHLRRKIGEALSWRQRLTIATQTADALHYLHSSATFPIYHRDVKSANILLDDDLNAKVADFGISKLAPVEATHVSTAAIQGTMGYIDPEYYTSFQLTDRSDVYSFGVTLFELISAKPVIDFTRDGDETSLVNFASPHIIFGDLSQLIDPALEKTYNDPIGTGKESILNAGRLAMKCVNMRSKARPSMKEVWEDLENLLLELDGTSKHLRNTQNEDNYDRSMEHEYNARLAESFNRNRYRSTTSMKTDNSSSIEMSQIADTLSSTS